MVHVRAVRDLALAALAIALLTNTQALNVDTNGHTQRGLQPELGLDTGLDLATGTDEATVGPSDASDSSAAAETMAPNATSSSNTTDASTTNTSSSVLSPVTNLLTTAPATNAPTATTATNTPSTDAPTTDAPAPTSVLSPVTNLLTTAPTTEAPTTEAPTTEAPTTEAPTTEAPTTEAPTTEAPTTEAPTATTTSPTNSDDSVLSPVTDLLTTAPTTDAPVATTAATTSTATTSPSTNAATTAPSASTTTTAPSTSTATTAPSTVPTTDAPTATPNSILTPVTDLLTTAPSATTAPAATTATSTTAPSTTTAPAATTATSTTAPSTAAPSTTTTPAATSVLAPVTDLITNAPTTAPSATTTPVATTTPDTTTTPSTTLLPDISTLIPSATTSTPTTTTTPSTSTSPATDSPITLIPSTDTPVTLIPSTDLPVTLTPTETPVTQIPTETPSTATPSPVTLVPTETPVTLIPTETPVTQIPTETPSTATPSPVTLIPTETPVTLIPTETPSTATPSPVTQNPTETPSTETPSTATPSTETPSTESPSTLTPSTTEEPSSSSGSGSSTNETTESPPPVTATPSSGSSEATSSPPPVTRAPSATKSPIAIETNSGSEDEQDASEQKDQTQSDVIMFNASATPILAKSGSSDPFAVPDDTTDTEKPVVLNIAGTTAESGSDEVETYVRGKTDTSASTATNANVIGGRNAYVDTEDSNVLSASSTALHEFLRYASVAFAGISVALLLFFHFVSLDGNLQWANAAWSPNTWEFLFYVGYLQQMQATSELTLLKTPYFLWDYTDSFAWSNFLIQDSFSGPAESRRLDTIVLGGLVSYADRIGIAEESILTHAASGFAVIMGLLLVVFLVLAVLAKHKAERALDESSDLTNYTSGVHRLRSVSIRALGLCVLVWYFSLFPLSMLASFEISMEVQASTVADALVVAIIALVLVCFGVLAVAGRVIMHKTKDELEQFENLATWGSLYYEYTYRSRMFFVIDVVVQIATGILVGCMSGDPTQLIVVMGVQILYLACVFIMSPFADQMVLRITYVLGLLKILNCGLAFAFLNSNTMSATARSRVAQAYIGINSIVILVWFVRQLIVFSMYIRAWMVRSNDDSRRSNSVIKYDPQTDTESELWASQFTARGANDSRGATLSMPANSSAQSMQSSFQGSSVQSMQAPYGQASAQQSMAPPFGSDAHCQQQMARKYEVGF